VFFFRLYWPTKRHSPMSLRCEEELRAPVQSPRGRLDLKAGHAGGLSGREGQPNVAPGHAGAQGVSRVGEGGIDLLEVFGSSSHGGVDGRDVARRNVAHASFCGAAKYIVVANVLD
jgi:hypothetical protein